MVLIGFSKPVRLLHPIKIQPIHIKRHFSGQVFGEPDAGYGLRDLAHHPLAGLQRLLKEMMSKSIR
jgi:hypothetical protein